MLVSYPNLKYAKICKKRKSGRLIKVMRESVAYVIYRKVQTGDVMGT